MVSVRFLLEPDTLRAPRLLLTARVCEAVLGDEVSYEAGEEGPSTSGVTETRVGIAFVWLLMLWKSVIVDPEDDKIGCQ